MMDATDENPVKGRAKGGKARAAALTPERRREIAKRAAQAKKEIAELPRATHEGAMTIGGVEIQCAVLEDGRRLITQSGFMRALGRARQAKGRDHYDGDVNLPAFLTAKNLKPFISKDLEVTSSQVEFRPISGTRAYGYPADLLPNVCDVFLDAHESGALTAGQKHIAARAQLLMRGLARVGIAALVDEATGYQRDREKDALAQILEAFVAKELQPWVKTFPADYYEHLFRLRGLPYPPEKANYRPQYFGKLTNDIVYKRLAPGLIQELKAQASKDEKKARLHQRLTSEVGHPKLREHLASVTTVMKLSSDYDDFVGKLDMIHPRYGDTMKLDV